MRKLLGVLAGFAVLTVVGAVYAAEAPAAAPAKEMTITGEVVDTGCYMGSGKRGAEHKGCAESCLKSGMPASILTADGTLYLLIPDHGDKAPFEAAKAAVSQMVAVTGPVSDKGGMHAITVKSTKVAATAAVPGK